LPEVRGECLRAHLRDHDEIAFQHADFTRTLRLDTSFFWISQKSARYSIDYALCKMAIALDFEIGAWTQFQKSQLNTKLTKMYYAKWPSHWILKQAPGHDFRIVISILNRLKLIMQNGHRAGF